MAGEGVAVEVHHIQELNPTEVPPADLYVFSSPGRMGKPIGRMRRFLRKLNLAVGAKYALLHDGDGPKPGQTDRARADRGEELARWQRVRPIMNEILQAMRASLKVGEAQDLRDGDEGPRSRRGFGSRRSRGLLRPFQSSRHRHDPEVRCRGGMPRRRPDAPTCDRTLELEEARLKGRLLASARSHGETTIESGHPGTDCLPPAGSCRREGPVPYTSQASHRRHDRGVVGNEHLAGVLRCGDHRCVWGFASRPLGVSAAPPCGPSRRCHKS